MISIVYRDAIENVPFRADLLEHLRLDRRQIRLISEKPTMRASTESWLAALIVIVVAKPFTDSFFKALGEEAAKGLADRIKSWFKKAKESGYQIVTLRTLELSPGAIKKPRWVRSIIRIDVSLKLKGKSYQTVTFVLPRNLSQRDVVDALRGIAQGDFPTPDQQAIYVYSHRYHKWSTAPKARLVSIKKTGKDGKTSYSAMKLKSPPYP